MRVRVRTQCAITLLHLKRSACAMARARACARRRHIDNRPRKQAFVVRVRSPAISLSFASVSRCQAASDARACAEYRQASSHPQNAENMILCSQRASIRLQMSSARRCFLLKSLHESKACAKHLCKRCDTTMLQTVSKCRHPRCRWCSCRRAHKVQRSKTRAVLRRRRCADASRRSRCCAHVAADLSSRCWLSWLERERGRGREGEREGEREEGREGEREGERERGQRDAVSGLLSCRHACSRRTLPSL